MKYKSSKEERFDSIYRSYVHEVYKVALHYSRDVDLAQDLTQQAFVNFYEHMEEVKPECIRAYLVRTVRNLTYSYFRIIKHEVREDGLVPDGVAVMETASDSLEEEYFRNQQRLQAERLSSEILSDVRMEHENWYDVLTMMYYYDRTHDEISEELGITKEVLYSRLHRAKHWIRKKYKKKIKDITDLA